MGHYDSCYEGDNQVRREKHIEETNKRFEVLCGSLKTEEKDFLMMIAKDIHDWMIFVKVIENLKK